MSNAIIGALRVNLGIDTAEFANGAKKAQGILGGLSGSIKAFAAGAVGALSLGGLAAVLRTTFNHMDNLNKAAQKFGLPVEELSRLEYAGRLADVSLETLGTSVQRLSKSLAEIQGGRENDAGKALAALKIAATDASGALRPTSEIMADVAEKFATMKDGAGKTAIAMALFGRSGAEMIPLLNGGRDAIKGAGDEAERFGLVITEQTAVAAEQFNDNLTRLKAVGEGLSTQVAAELAPAMAQLSDELVNVVGSGDMAKAMAEAINFVMQEMRRFVLEASAAWQEVTRWIAAAQESLTALGNMDLSGAGAAWKRAAEDVNKIWADTAAKVAEVQATISGAGKGSLPSAKRTQAAPIIEFADAAERLAKVGKPVNLLEGVRELKDSIEPMPSMVDDLARAFGDAFNSIIFEGAKAKDVLRSLLDQIFQMSFQMLGQVGGQAGFGNAGGSLFGKLFGGFFASGGHLGAGKWGIAGEAGPEIVHGPANISPMGGMSVTVINQNGSRIDTREGAGGLEIRVFDDAMSRALSDPNSKSSRALRGLGVAPPVRRR